MAHAKDATADLAAAKESLEAFPARARDRLKAKANLGLLGGDPVAMFLGLADLVTELQNEIASVERVHLSRHDFLWSVDKEPIDRLAYDARQAIRDAALALVPEQPNG